jgi:hypothetical protein
METSIFSSRLSAFKTDIVMAFRKLFAKDVPKPRITGKEFGELIAHRGYAHTGDYEFID